VRGRRYLAADLHLGDENVLEFTDRPFPSVAAMNERLLENWNAVVDPNDEVLFVGDLVVPSEPATVRRWLQQLNGKFVFVAGDHDDGARQTPGVTTQPEYRFEAGGYRFQCVHHPDDAPAERDGWLVHGHHHDLRTERFPFVDPEARRVNVSIELLGYEPIPLEELLGYLDRGERLRTRPA
jgi:calcineurin-like phosphoesterase family protein